MPIIKSAKKRVRVTRRATIRNAQSKRILKNAVKAFHKGIESNKKKAPDLHKTAQSELDKAAKKHIMHKNKVARKQRQLARAAKTAGIALAASKKTSPSPAKKTTVKAKTTPTRKKPTTKK